MEQYYLQLIYKFDSLCVSPDRVMHNFITDITGGLYGDINVV